MSCKNGRKAIARRDKRCYTEKNCLKTGEEYHADCSQKDEQGGMAPEVIGAYIARIVQKRSCAPICVAGAQYKFLSRLCKLLPCPLRGKIVGAIYAK